MKCTQSRASSTDTYFVREGTSGGTSAYVCSREIIIIASWRNNMVRGTARRKTTAKQVESFGQSVKGIQEPEHGLGSPK